jgi:uncharacterized protein YprB with RNaseH-like and TPR domain
MSSISTMLDMYEEKTEYSVNTDTVIKDTSVSESGYEKETPYGNIYIIEKAFDINHLHGKYPLECLLNYKPEALLKTCGINSPSVSLEDILFLDTETTGLSHGVSTYVFLTGMGYFKDNYFILKQYFMRGIGDELPLLYDLKDFMKEFKCLVTFNGKAFDMNILKSRFLVNRITDFKLFDNHVDLLYPTRMIWREVYENCRLSTMEKRVLGLFRQDDIPGEMIPGEYYKYINYGNTDNIKKIINHNELDILSMVTLMYIVNRYLEKPTTAPENIKEVFNLGRMFKKKKYYRKAVLCFSKCLNSSSFSINYNSLLELSLIYKKAFDYKNAVRIWEIMINDVKRPSLFPFLELAKYYEHKHKNCSLALNYVDKAIKTEHMKFTPSCAVIEELQKRRDRLILKLCRKEAV